MKIANTGGKQCSDQDFVYIKKSDSCSNTPNTVNHIRCHVTQQTGIIYSDLEKIYLYLYFHMSQYYITGTELWSNYYTLPWAFHDLGLRQLSPHITTP